jgi:uncharacterized membrane protein YgcG
MKTLVCPKFVAVFAIVIASGIAGCSSYNYKAQTDSAFVRGTDNVTLFNVNNRTFVGILRVDGLYVGMPMNFNSGVYLSPGSHEISLLFNPQSSEFTDMDNTLEASFAANHRYNLSISTDTVDITLWDETASADKAVKVAEWSFGETDTPEKGPIESVDLNNAILVRPPFGRVDNPPRSGGSGDHDHPPPHVGGPPSIPHNPRPSPGGGGGQSSGGNHSGGGGHASGGDSGSDGRKK